MLRACNLPLRSIIGGGGYEGGGGGGEDFEEDGEVLVNFLFLELACDIFSG
jgi:hypothetical protein